MRLSPKKCCLVVWNICYFSIQLGMSSSQLTNNHPNWLFNNHLVKCQNDPKWSKMMPKWFQTYSKYVELDFTSILSNSRFLRKMLGLWFAPALDPCETKQENYPLVIKQGLLESPDFLKLIRIIFLPKCLQSMSIYELCPIAMFDCRRVAHPISGFANPFGFRRTSVGPSSICSWDQETPWISVTTVRMLRVGGFNPSEKY